MGPIVFGRLAARAAMATEPATGYTLKTPAAVITEDMFAKDADGAESLFDMSQTLVDGEYEATVDGQEGPMTVKVTVADGKIAAVVVAEPTRQAEISYAVFCLKKKKKTPEHRILHSTYQHQFT